MFNCHGRGRPEYYLSAYGLALKHGFRGTEEEWLESLKPVLGTDYFTEAEKRQFINQVLDQIEDGDLQEAVNKWLEEHGGGGGLDETKLEQYLERNNYAKTDDIPSKLSHLEADSDHQTISTADRQKWNAAINETGLGQYLTSNRYAKTTDIPSKLSELEQDSNHMTVTADEKAKWNSKGDSDLSNEIADIRDALGIRQKARVVLMDDDGTLKEYTMLRLIAIDKKVPINFAIPVESIGSSATLNGERKYCNWDEIQEMALSPYISYSIHGNTAMSATMQPSEMEGILNNWFDSMKQYNALPAVGTPIVHVYPTGAANDTIINEVIKPFERDGRKISAGLTVTKGTNYAINQYPWNRYKMYRCGLFPSDGSFTMEQAREYVDQLAEQGGTIFFFTHCYYDSFNADEYRSFIDYIRAKGVEIVSAAEAITAYDKFVAAKEGKQDETTGETGEWVLTDDYQVYTSKAISYETSTPPGVLINHSSANNEVAVMNIQGYTRVRVSGTAYSRYGKASFLDEMNSMISCVWQDDNVSGTAAQFENLILNVPANAATLLVSGNITRLDPKIEVWVSGGSKGEVTKEDLEELESRFSESITEIQNQIGYAEADLAALLGEVESVVSKF